ncbi:MAG: hypothetical protein ACQER7_14750 [Bacteroidota bacterium]
MEKIKIHIAEQSFEGDIPVFEVEPGEMLLQFITDMLNYDNEIPGNPIVYLINIYDEVIVTDNKGLVREIFDFRLDIESLDISLCEECFIQKYLTFEAAYKVALSMREIKPNCYGETQWMLVANHDETILHMIPVHERLKHTIESDCPCNPKEDIESGIKTYIHNEIFRIFT